MHRCHRRGAELRPRALSWIRRLSPIAALVGIFASTTNCGSDNGSTGGPGSDASVGGSGGAAGGTGGAAVNDSSRGGDSTGMGGANNSGGGAGNRGGTTNTGGATDSGRTADVTSAALGAACTDDAACGGGGLVCVRPTDSAFFGNGGPPGGYCTFACNAVNATTCQSQGGSCVDLALNPTDPPAPYCLRSCTFGIDDPANMKCLVRGDVACTLINQTTMQGVCLPVCSMDSQCPAGRRCDPLLAVCVDMPTAGDSVGTHCTADADAAATCAGTCISLGAGTVASASVCSRRCVTGLLEECDWVGQGMPLTGARHGVCYYSNSQAQMGGDLGFCAELCDTVSDCHDSVDPAPICDMTFASAIGHGVCAWGVATDGGVRDSAASSDARAPADARGDGRD